MQASIRWRTLAAGCAVLGLVGCGSKTLDVDDAEQKIAAELERQVGQRPKAVDCPSDIEAKEGNTERCTITAPNGEKIGLTLTTTDDEGNFRFEVDRR